MHILAISRLILHVSRSDPVIEPMLQSIPDPFDSYGPPPADDQIFSILPPLSIMVPSSTPSPVPRSPEMGSEGLPTPLSRNNSWTTDNFNENLYPAQSSSEWSEVSQPTSPTTPRSVSPPSPVSRRHSAPPHSLTASPHRKSESKLRSVLSAIDESQGQPNESGINGGTIKAPKAEKAPSITSFTWTSSFPFGHSDQDQEEATPRRATFPPPQTDPPPISTTPPHLESAAEQRSYVPVTS